ncbi:YxiG-like protein [Arthrobacter sp. 2MCAF14]|uniref:YxiG-like protein n=1 Tax=Arthrobacter sp. 2MCAF14 TaxID=3232982 RepID=UPI003F8F235F
MNKQQLSAAFEEVFDDEIAFHGFAEHMRDYDVFVSVTADPSIGIGTDYLRYRFTHCVRATVTSAVAPSVWKRSLDERLTDYEAFTAAGDLNGYVWGVNYQVLDPGMTLLGQSSEASGWTEQLGIPFHEARIQTNGHNLELVFSDLVVERMEPGFAPFRVPTVGKG